MTRLLDENRRWLVLGTLFLAAGVNVGSSNYAFGLFVEPLETTFGWSRTAISASLSFVAVGSLASPIIGRLMDRHGARPVLFISLTLMGISFLVRPAMTELWHWYGLSFLQFIGISGITALPAGRLIAIWFPSSQGRIMGHHGHRNQLRRHNHPLHRQRHPGRIRVAGGIRYHGPHRRGLGGARAALHPRVSFGCPRRLFWAVPGREQPDVRSTVVDGHEDAQLLRDRGARWPSAPSHTREYSPNSSLTFKELGVPSAWAALTVTVMAVTGLVSKPTFGYLSEHMTARPRDDTYAERTVRRRGAVGGLAGIRMGWTADLRGQYGRPTAR